MRKAMLSRDSPLPADTGLGVAAPGSGVTRAFPSPCAHRYRLHRAGCELQLKVLGPFSPEREAPICTRCPPPSGEGDHPQATGPSIRRTACYRFEFQTSSAMMADAISLPARRSSSGVGPRPSQRASALVSCSTRCAGITTRYLLPRPAPCRPWHDSRRGWPLSS